MKQVALALALGAALAACGGGSKPVAKDMKAPTPVPGFVVEKLALGNPGISFTSAADDYYSFVEYGPKGSGGAVPGTQVGQAISNTLQTYPVGQSPYYWPTEITVAIIPRAAGFGGCASGGGGCMQVIFSSSLHNDAYHPCLVGTMWLASGFPTVVGTAAKQGWYYPGAMFPGYFGIDSQNSGAQMILVSTGGPNPSSGTLQWSNGANLVFRNLLIVFPDGGPYTRPSNAKIWVSVETPDGAYVYNQYSSAAINPG
jgi:hypothetical protein